MNNTVEVRIQEQAPPTAIGSISISIDQPIYFHSSTVYSKPNDYQIRRHQFDVHLLIRSRMRDKNDSVAHPYNSSGALNRMDDKITTWNNIRINPYQSLKNLSEFISALPSHVVKPNWNLLEDDEVIVEWKSDSARVLVTFDEDSGYGYATLVSGSFKPGNTEVNDGSIIAEDLMAYLMEHFVQ